MRKYGSVSRRSIFKRLLTSLTHCKAVFYHVLEKQIIESGQENTQVQLPKASKLYSWTIGKGSLVVRWESEISPSSLVS